MNLLFGEVAKWSISIVVGVEDKLSVIDADVESQITVFLISGLVSDFPPVMVTFILKLIT